MANFSKVILERKEAIWKRRLNEFVTWVKWE